MTSRRFFMQGAGLALAGLSSVGAGAVRRSPPLDVNRKFAPNGMVIPFGGNTIICHLPQQGPDSAPFNALLDIYRDLPAHPFAHRITATPPSSYHMTIFGGANDKDRRLAVWPAGLPLDMPIATVDRILGDRLKGFDLGMDAPPYRMKVNPVEPAAGEVPLTIRLVPADTETEAKLRKLRNRLADLLGIHAPGHDSYGFHITLGYTINWLSPAENVEFRRALNTWREMLNHRAPVITLGAPEYCLLDDMFAFRRQFYL